MAQKGRIDADVGIQMNPQGMATTLTALQGQIDNIIKALNTAGQKAEEAVAKSGKAGERAIKQAEQAASQAARSLNRAFGTLETARGANARGLMGAFQQDQKIGKTAEAMARWVDSLNAGGTASANLTRRINENTQSFAQMARRGEAVTAGQIRQQEALRSTLKAYEEVNRAQRGMFSGLGSLSEQNRNSLNPLLTQLHNLDKQLTTLTNRPNRVTFNSNLSEQARITGEIQKQIKELQKEELGEKKLTEQVRERARALLEVSQAQRASAFETGANRFATIAGATRSNPFANPSITLNTANLAERLQRALALSAVNMNALQRAYLNNAPAERLQTLIDRQNRLNGLMQQAEGLMRNQERGQARTGGFFAGLKQSTGNLLGEEGGGFGFGAGALVGRVASYAVAATAIYGLINALQSAARFAIGFEDRLASLQAISGATSLEMVRLSGSLLELSENSNRSVIELTEAATVIVQAGFSAQETAEVLKNVVTLSAASGSSLADSSDIIVSALGAFQLQASEAGRVVNSLTTILNASKLGINQIQLALQYVGATAQDSNISLEELIASVGTLADVGVRGSTAATGLRQFLIELRDPSNKLVDQLQAIGLSIDDINVAQRGLIPVLRTLRDAGFDAYSALETRSAAAYLALSNNIPNLEYLRETTLTVNAAQEAQAARLDTLAAKWQQFLNRLAEIGAALGSVVIPTLKEVLDLFNGLYDLLGEISEPLDVVRQGLNDFQNYINRDLLGRETPIDDLNTSLDESVTAFNDARAAADAQSQSISTLDREVNSIISRYDSLIQAGRSTTEASSELSYETEQLANRFPELREQLEDTVLTTDKLREAYSMLRGEMQRELIDSSRDALGANRDAQLTRESVIERNRRQLESVYGRNGSIGQTSLNPLAGPLSSSDIIAGRRTPAILENIFRDVNSEEARRLLDQFMHDERISHRVREQFNTELQQYISEVRAQRQSVRQERRLQTNLHRATEATTPVGANALRVADDNARNIPTFIRNLRNLPIADRGNNGNFQRNVTALQSFIATLTRIMNNSNNPGSKAFYEELIARQTRLLNDVRQAIVPSDEEQRIHGIGVEELARRLRAQFGNQGLRVTDTLRSRGEQQVLYDRYRAGRGNLAASPDRAPHVQGRAIDLGREVWPYIDEVVRYIESQGVEVTRVLPRNTYRDGHAHIEIGLPRSQYQRRQEQDTQRDAREAERQRMDALRDEARILRETTEAKKDQLELTIDNLDRQEGLVNLEQQTGQVLVDYENYRTARTAQAEAEARVQNLTGDNLTRYMAQINSQLDTDWQETVRDAAGKINTAFRNFIQRREQILEDQFNVSILNSQRNTGRQEGLLAGLNDPLTSNQVPEYTRTLQQHRVESSQRSLQDTTFQANQARLAGLRQEMEQVQRLFDSIAVSDIKEEQRVEYEASIRRITDAIRELETEQSNLLAQYQALSLAPTTWRDSINQAIQAFRLQTGAGLTMSQRIRNDLGGAIEGVHQSFQTFFSDVIRGNKSIGQSFKDLAMGIIDSMLKMFEQAIATQFFNIVLSAIPGNTGSQYMSSSGYMNYPGGFIGFSNFQGGGIGFRNATPKRLLTGGMVSAGIPTRDSVPILASKGEFMFRSSAVESIGHDLLQDMNNRGAAALKHFNNQNVVIPQTPVLTNVYIIPPEEQPQMGPHDVIATWTRDVVNNGPTKRLIKQVASGG